jgi:hypothetical protein
MLTPGQKVLLRRRAIIGEGPWLTAMASIPWPRAWGEIDNGWLVQDAGDGLLMLQSLTLSGVEPASYLWGDPASKTVMYKNPDVDGHDGVRWKVHPAVAGTFLLECISQLEGPKWLYATQTNWIRLSDRPTERSVWHEFVALPLEGKDQFQAAEDQRDYSFMTHYEMAPDGWRNELPRPAPVGEIQGLTSQWPKARAGTDPVALELIAALQPFFNDGDAGAKNSDYEPDDPRRHGWPHNIISLDTVATPTGILYLHGQPIPHVPYPGELDHCRTLAAQVVSLLGELRPFDGESPTPFLPFYLVAGEGDPIPKRLTADFIRAAFGETIYPDTPIEVVPLNEQFAIEDHPAWGDFVRWVLTQSDLAHMAYVKIGYDTGQEPNYAAVFPRLILGLTNKGSLVGACGSIVQA